MNQTQVGQAREAWLDIPGGAVVRASFAAGKGKLFKALQKITLRQQAQLQERAAREGKSIDRLLNDALGEEVRALLLPAGQYESFEAIFRAGKEKEVEAQLQERFAKRVRGMLLN